MKCFFSKLLLLSQMYTVKYLKNRLTMCTCELMLSFVLFGWSLIAISEKAIIEKIKVLL